MMTPAQARDLAELRQAAHERNLEQVQFLLKRLLPAIDYYALVALVLERLYSFLDIFESYYPDEAWIRQMFVTIAAYGYKPDDSIATQALQQPFHEAGCGNYIKAVYDFTQGMQDKHPPEARISFFVSAMVNSIMAELAEAWYAEYPTAWEIVQNSPRDPLTGQALDPTADEIAVAFWMDDLTASLDVDMWLEVADEIERALAR